VFSFASFPGRACFILYSYKYLESDLIKHCHVISIHSLGQPLIVRSHVRSTDREEIPRKFPREPHVFPIIVISLDSTDNTQGVQRQIHKTACIESLGVCHNATCIQSLGVCRKAAGILLHGVWCKYTRNSIPIITLIGVSPDGLSPLEKVCHPRARLGWPYFSLGDKPSGHTPTKVIIV
jgi:hypothetical protein